jgi:hypothetical protein
MQALIGFPLFIMFLAVGAVQIYLGFIGIEYHLGGWAAWVAIGLMFVGRLMLPLTIGCYFGAVNVWGWEWWQGLLIAAPGLLFIVPALVMTALEPILQRRA